MVSYKLIEKAARRVYDSAIKGSVYTEARKHPRLLAEATRFGNKEFAKKSNRALGSFFREKERYLEGIYSYLKDDGRKLEEFTNKYWDKINNLGRTSLDYTEISETEKRNLTRLCPDNQVSEYFYDLKKGFGIIRDDGVEFTLKNPELLEDKFQILKKYKRLYRKKRMLQEKVQNRRNELEFQRRYHPLTSRFRTPVPLVPLIITNNSSTNINQAETAIKEIRADNCISDQDAFDYARENGVYPE